MSSSSLFSIHPLPPHHPTLNPSHPSLSFSLQSLTLSTARSLSHSPQSSAPPRTALPKPVPSPSSPNRLYCPPSPNPPTPSVLQILARQELRASLSLKQRKDTVAYIPPPRPLLPSPLLSHPSSPPYHLVSHFPCTHLSATLLLPSASPFLSHITLASSSPPPLLSPARSLAPRCRSPSASCLLACALLPKSSPLRPLRHYPSSLSCLPPPLSH